MVSDKNIKEFIIEGDKVYLKKDFTGWRIVHPPKNPDGSLNWFNILVGGWGNLIFVLFILGLTFTFFYVYNHDTAEMQKVVGNPCGYCLTTDMQNTLNERNEQFDIVNAQIKNRTEFNFEFNLSGGRGG